MGAPSVPPKIRQKAGTTDTLEPVSGRFSVLDLGVISVTEGTEATVLEWSFTNNLGVEFVGYRMTLTMTDETDGTEDVVMKEYLMTNGTLTEV